jgi:hypothetical protein
MRISNVEIREIDGRINQSAKSLVLHLDDGIRFNILLGVGRPQSTELIFTSIHSLYEAHIAISYNLLLRDFIIVKHRFAADNTRFNSINGVNRLLSQQFLNMGFEKFDVLHIISK